MGAQAMDQENGKPISRSDDKIIRVFGSEQEQMPPWHEGIETGERYLSAGDCFPIDTELFVRAMKPDLQFSYLRRIERIGIDKPERIVQTSIEAAQKKAGLVGEQTRYSFANFNIDHPSQQKFIEAGEKLVGVVPAVRPPNSSTNARSGAKAMPCCAVAGGDVPGDSRFHVLPSHVHVSA